MKDPHPLQSSFVEPATPSTDFWRGHMADSVGATFGPDPLASLTASEGELHLTGTLGTYRMSRTDVTKISSGCMYPWFFRAIRIRGKKGDELLDLQFKPLGESHAAVLKRLQQLGYPTR